MKYPEGSITCNPSFTIDNIKICGSVARIDTTMKRIYYNYSDMIQGKSEIPGAAVSNSGKTVFKQEYLSE